MKPDTDKNGYHVYRFSNGQSFKKAAKAHRLVAIAFIPNPNNYPIVNHKNGIKHDNRVENLEWCTNAHNIQHAFDNELIVPYVRKFTITDTKTNTIVCVTHGYDFLIELTGFSYAYIGELNTNNKMLFTHYRIDRVKTIDPIIEAKMLNRRFIKRTITHKNKPLMYDNVVYDSLVSLYHSGVVAKYQYEKARRNKFKNNNKIIHEGKEIKFITHYEYVNY